MATKVVTECISKKETKNYYNGDPKANPKAYEIELQVAYDPNSVYYNLSGGTNIVLRTINEDAANEFQIGEQYEILISKVEKEG
jgi:hypothetical protein